MVGGQTEWGELSVLDGVGDRASLFASVPAISKGALAFKEIWEPFPEVAFFKLENPKTSDTRRIYTPATKW